MCVVAWLNSFPFRVFSKEIMISLENSLLSFILSCSSKNHSRLVDRINLIFFKVCSFCLCLQLLPHTSSDFYMSSLGAQGSFFAFQASPDTCQVTYLPLEKKPHVSYQLQFYQLCSFITTVFFLL